MPQIIVFTDLDGTLLDHEDYSFKPALPALNELRKHDVPLILASSKTAPEIESLHAQLGLGAAPAIVENGAGLFWPDRKNQEAPEVYTKLRSALNALPTTLRKNFSGFGDMSIAEISALTGLSDADARDAASRRFSEPGLWSGSTIGLREFKSALAEQNVFARSGGRFLTLSHGATKADHMNELRAHYRATTTIALGDAPNDQEMLDAADYGVIVRNSAGIGLPTMEGEATGRIVRTNEEGPKGWNNAVLTLLQTLMPNEQFT